MTKQNNEKDEKTKTSSIVSADGIFKQRLYMHKSDMKSIKIETKLH